MKKYIVLLFLILPLCAISQEEKIPVPEDFAGELELTGTGGSLLKIEIPEGVYPLLERSDRGDIRVFDAEGNMVPFVVRDTPGVRKIPPPEEIPFFPWQEESGGNLPRGTDIEVDSEGMVLRIKNQNFKPGNSRGFLLDLSGLEYRPAALNLEIAQKEFFNAAVILFSGNDLGVWKEFEKRQIIAWYGESGASRTRVELPAGKPRYLLLRFDRGELLPQKITALFEETEVSPPLRIRSFPGEPGQNRRFVEYRNMGFFPVVSLDFALAESDSIEIQVQNKQAAEETWNPVSSMRIYRIVSANGGVIKNRPLATSGAAPFWRIEARGEAVFTQTPECQIYWKSEELVFLGRGKGPWKLSFGCREWGPPQPGLLGLSEYSAGEEAPIADAGTNGEIRLREREAAKPLKDFGQWLLWAILIAAAAILTALAFVTAKSMAREK